MRNQEIPIASVTIPSAGLIPFLRKDYTDQKGGLYEDLIQEWFYDLYCQHRIDPSYLFVSPKGRSDLRKVVRRVSEILDRYSSGYTYCSTVVEDMSNRYLNKVTGRWLHVVELPTMPDNCLLLGDLKIAETRESWF